jgi:hypothetical protein
MITLNNGTYSTVSFTLTEDLIINGLDGGSDIINTHHYVFKVVDKLTEDEYLYLASTQSYPSGDENSGSSAWIRSNKFTFAVNVSGVTASNGGLEVINDTPSQWNYEVWAVPNTNTDISTTDGTILESGRLLIK